MFWREERGSSFFIAARNWYTLYLPLSWALCRSPGRRTKVIQGWEGNSRMCFLTGSVTICSNRFSLKETSYFGIGVFWFQTVRWARWRFAHSVSWFLCCRLFSLGCWWCGIWLLHFTSLKFKVITTLVFVKQTRVDVVVVVIKNFLPVTLWWKI